MEHIAKLFTGVPRTTADIDLLVDFEEKNIVRFEEILKKQNYKFHFAFPSIH